MSFKKPITFFNPVFIGQNSSAQLTAMPVEGNGSGDFASLQGTDGFVEFGEYHSLYAIGAIVPFYAWKY
jgi:molybdopterin molybdotransferase